MIVPMRKIALVVLDREREEALRALRKLGVLHIEKRDAASQGIADLQGLVARMDTARSILAEAGKKGKNASKKYARKDAQALSRDEAIAIADTVIELSRKLDESHDAIRRADAELERLEPWGQVNPDDFTWLSARGITLKAYGIPLRELDLLPPDARWIELGRDKKNAKLVFLADNAFHAETLPQTAREFVLPEASSDAIRSERLRALEAIPETEKLLSGYARHQGALLAAGNAFRKELEFETIRAGMPEVSFGSDSQVAENSALAWLTGFVPASDGPLLAAEAKKRGWGYLSEEPSEEEAVPTQLKNNRFVTIISPLLEFLGVLPGYREIDISSWFVLFFGLFFAMIFGDGGYGLLLVMVSLIGIGAYTRKKEKIPTAFFMFLYLALMTVGWGAITCTWFGLPPENLPSFLRGIAIPAFSSENPESAGNIKMFCFVVALIQLSLAHVIGIIRNIRSFKALGELGTLLMLNGMFVVVLSLLVDAQKYPISNAVLAVIFAGFILNFVFNNYSGSVIASILESLKNFITVILGVVNVFGDIMSYIRLWAVGLAGAAISATVNSMAGPMFGSFFMFLAVLVLFFGHGLNLMMNVLSVIVHGVRLNTLEFSNHLGLTWSGFKYEPFSETGKE